MCDESLKKNVLVHWYRMAETVRSVISSGFDKMNVFYHVIKSSNLMNLFKNSTCTLYKFSINTGCLENKKAKAWYTIHVKM